jgi:hypothetical protein
MNYRLVEFNRSGTTSYTKSNNFHELTSRLDDGVEAGCLTGGDVEAYVLGIGWVAQPVEIKFEK